MLRITHFSIINLFSFFSLFPFKSLGSRGPNWTNISLLRTLKPKVKFQHLAKFQHMLKAVKLCVK